MAVFRVEKNRGYTVMSNHHLRNKALSLKAKGLLSQMLSLPEDWDYTLKGLSLINRESIDAIRTAVWELEKAGYIRREQGRDPKGKMADMLIVQDQIWGRVTQNRSQGRETWFVCDEFHLLLREEQTAAYSAEIWKRFRKWGGIPTGATQNVKDLLSSPEIENILENSDFIVLLNQAAGDRKILAERLNLSAEQQKYIDNAEPGEGLLIYENVVLPFRNPIPKNTQLYQIMTPRLSEVAGV